MYNICTTLFAGSLTCLTDIDVREAEVSAFFLVIKMFLDNIIKLFINPHAFLLL